MTDRLTPPFEFKLAEHSATVGTFSGYASTFEGPIDSYGHKIAHGAFDDSLAEHRRRGTVPALLWTHDIGEPIGKWTELRADAKGLAVSGKLTLGTKRGAEAHALMKDDALGLSIGFRVRPNGARADGRVRTLTAIDLIEISAVSLPSNPAARVLQVKSQLERPDTVRDLEAALHELGFSGREAKRIAGAGWRALEDDSDEIKQVVALLAGAVAKFSVQR